MEEGSELLPSDQLSPQLKTVNLSHLCGSKRFQTLDMKEAYYRCQQYEGRKYDWDGNMRGYAQAADIAPGWYVPLDLRRPNARYDLARLIVRRFTAMVFGADRFPQLLVEGDDDAQDYVRALAEAAKLPSRMQEIRNKGGAQGAVGASFGFVDGKPRIGVHNAKHVTILRWADRYEHRPAEVLESYAYPRTVWDVKSGKPKEITMYYARYWNEEVETTWEPIKAEVAREPGWQSSPFTTIRHGFEFCPFYWAQNLPETDDIDGDSDYEGMLDTLDQINKLLSATVKGTIANVDPTLVIKDEPRKNPGGAVRKGQGNAIWSKGGAEYLELKGDSLKASLALLTELKKETLDTVGVVLGDPEKASGAVQSGTALRMLYLPMLTQSDILRDQYGTLIVQIMKGLLVAAKQIWEQEPGEVSITEDGHRMQEKPTVLLPPRVIKEPGERPPPGEMGKAEDATTTTEPRVPGESENITLNWPPYFPNTWADTTQAVDAIQKARGGSGAIISRRTATENVSTMLGVTDVDRELAEIAEDQATDAAFAAAAMETEVEIMGPPQAPQDPIGPNGGPPPKKPKPKGV